MNISILPATSKDKMVIQNMARFYAYDLSRFCGIPEADTHDWSFPKDGLYESNDLSPYWEESDRFPFIIHVDNELAGFALINKIGTRVDIDWNMGEFFIVAKFQRRGVGKKVAFWIFDKFKGKWEVNQIPSNKPAINFWKKIISEYSKEQFIESTKTILKPKKHNMIVLEFQS